jgi:dynein heavy chain, axonemal
MKHMHQSVAAAAKDFLSQARRYTYVTPTSYLEVLSTYKAVLKQKRTEVGTLRDRLQVRCA